MFEYKLSKRDITLLKNIVTLSRKSNVAICSLLDTYNLRRDSVYVILNCQLSAKLDINNSTPENLEEEILFNLNKLGDSIDNQNMYNSLLSNDIHKEWYKVTYVNRSLYKMISSEIYTGFKDIRVTGYIEEAVSSILGSIIRIAKGIMDNSESYLLDSRFLRGVEYENISSISNIHKLLSNIKVGFESCAQVIDDIVKLYITRHRKISKIQKLCKIDTEELTQYESDELKSDIRRIKRQVAHIDREIDVALKYCAYSIKLNIDKCHIKDIVCN